MPMIQTLTISNLYTVCSINPLEPDGNGIYSICLTVVTSDIVSTANPRTLRMYNFNNYLKSLKTAFLLTYNKQTNKAFKLYLDHIKCT